MRNKDLKKILITGSEGFVGTHLINLLIETKKYEIIGVSRTRRHEVCNYELHILDISNSDVLDILLRKTKPDYLIHLAAFSSVSKSWEDPISCFKNNTDIYINILESVRKNCMKCRILSIGSSEEYGQKNNIRALHELSKLNPNSPYAVARVSQEYLSHVYVEGYGLDIVLTRSFNHIGPGQRETFAIPSFVNKALKSKGIIEVGNISFTRDFTDVRDVVKAYVLLLEKGVRGEVYNICSGIGYVLEDLLKMILVLTNKEKTVIRKVNHLIRPLDIKSVIGNNDKIRRLGWEPKIKIDESINDIIKYQRNANENSI